MEVTRKEILREIEESKKDFDTFSQARDKIRSRVLDVADSAPRLLPFTQWSGTDAVLGTLDLVCNAIERTIEDLKTSLGQVPVEPRLRLVKDEEDEPKS